MRKVGMVVNEEKAKSWETLNEEGLSTSGPHQEKTKEGLAARNFTDYCVAIATSGKGG